MFVTHLQKIGLSAVVGIFGLFALLPSAGAFEISNFNSAEIENTITTRVESGGDNPGTARTEVHIEGEVNGRELSPVHRIIETRDSIIDFTHEIPLGEDDDDVSGFTKIDLQASANGALDIHNDFESGALDINNDFDNGASDINNDHENGALGVVSDIAMSADDLEADISEAPEVEKADEEEESEPSQTSLLLAELVESVMSVWNQFISIFNF